MMAVLEAVSGMLDKLQAMFFVRGTISEVAVHCYIYYIVIYHK